MATYFADTSALTKRYVTEAGSNWLRTQFAPAKEATIYLARITSVELIAALSRRERGGTLAEAASLTARASFRSHLITEYQIIEVTETLAEQAMRLAEVYGLRGYDAVQLAAAIALHEQYVAAGMPPITLLSSDAELNAAARSEGLNVDNPNSHP